MVMCCHHVTNPTIQMPKSHKNSLHLAKVQYEAWCQTHLLTNLLITLFRCGWEHEVCHVIRTPYPPILPSPPCIQCCGHAVTPLCSVTLNPTLSTVFPAHCNFKAYLTSWKWGQCMENERPWAFPFPMDPSPSLFIHRCAILSTSTLPTWNPLGNPPGLCCEANTLK